MILQCLGCRGLFDRELMETDTLCVKCWAIAELKKKGGDTDVKANRKEHGDRRARGKAKVLPLGAGLPIASGERVRKSDGRNGQMSLPIMSALDPACQA